MTRLPADGAEPDRAAEYEQARRASLTHRPPTGGDEVVSQFAVVVDDPQRRMDCVTIGPFEHRADATAEARRWREGGGRAMVRYLWEVEADELDVLRRRRQGDAFP